MVMQQNSILKTNLKKISHRSKYKKIILVFIVKCFFSSFEAKRVEIFSLLQEHISHESTKMLLLS